MQTLFLNGNMSFSNSDDLILIPGVYSYRVGSELIFAISILENSIKCVDHSRRIVYKIIIEKEKHI